MDRVESICKKQEKRENSIMSVGEATNSLKREKAIFVITDMNDYVNIMGYICYISKNEDTYDKLIDEYHKLGKEGKQVMLIGSYEDGCVTGVQYIHEE